MSLAHNTSTCRGANFAKNKKKKRKSQGNLIFWNCMSQDSTSPPPSAPPPNIFTSFCNRLCQQHKKILRFVQLSEFSQICNSMKFEFNVKLLLQLNLNSIQK
jgi:hypothetical protein